MHFLIFLSCREDEVGMDLKRAEESGDGARNKVRWGPVLVEKVIRVSHLEAIGVNQKPSRTKKEKIPFMRIILGVKVGYHINPTLLIIIICSRYAFAAN